MVTYLSVASLKSIRSTRSPKAMATPRWMKPSRSIRSPSPASRQHAGGAELEDPGPYPLHDVLPRLALEDDALDAPEVEQMREQQTRRSAADDHHLCVDSDILPELRRRKAEDGRRKSECWRLHAVRVAALSGRVMLGSTSDGGPRCLVKPRTVGPRWSELER